MNDGMYPHIRLLPAIAVFLLFAITGPEAVWLSFRVRLPACDPGAAHSVAALMVLPESAPVEP